MQRLSKSLLRSYRSTIFARYNTTRLLHGSPVRAQERSDPAAHRNFYKSHGRAIAKAFTLAFFSYQVFYWAWITIETEQMKDQKSYEIKSLEGEVRLLDEGRKSHRPVEQAHEVDIEGKRVLEEPKKP